MCIYICISLYIYIYHVISCHVWPKYNISREREPYMCMYTYVSVYMSWGSGFTVPPPDGMVPRMGSQCEWNMYAMHAYAYICMNIWACMSALHMHALHNVIMHAGICAPGMHAPTYPCMACMHDMQALSQTAPPHHIPQGGRASPWLGPLRGGSHGHLQGPPHITQGKGQGPSPSPSPSPYHHHPRGAGGGATPHWTRDIYVYAYMYV